MGVEYMSKPKSRIVIEELELLASFIKKNGKSVDFSVKDNAKTVTVYRLDNYFITVKRDANTETYAINIRLKASGTLTGKADTDGVIASPYANGAVPF